MFVFKVKSYSDISRKWQKDAKSRESWEKSEPVKVRVYRTYVFLYVKVRVTRYVCTSACVSRNVCTFVKARVYVCQGRYFFSCVNVRV